MKTSARNAIRGSIVNIVSDMLSAEIEVSVSPQTTIYSLVTHTSMEELGLYSGRSVTLLIKAPFVAIATGKAAPKTSARNCISGIISRCETSAVSAEVVLDIGAAKTLASSITAQSAKSLRLSPGKPAFAIFDAAHVIIAIN
ncbi:TOBE domain-containing protein [Nitrobacter sp.]